MISSDPARCGGCGGRFDALSRQATQNSMGPWSVRGPNGREAVYKPGCSFEVIASMAASGRIGPNAVVRGPSTRQFWTLARRVPGIANLFGFCHNCQKGVSPEAYGCESCGAVFEVDRDRQHLGLGPVRLLPGQASAERVSAHAAAVNPPTPTPGDHGTAPADDSLPIPPASPGLDRRLRGALDRQRRLTGLLLVVVVVLAGSLVWVALDTGVLAADPPRVNAASEAEPETSPGVTPEPSEDTAVAPEPEPESPYDRAMALVSEGSMASLRLAAENLESADELDERSRGLLEQIRDELATEPMRALP